MYESFRVTMQYRYMRRFLLILLQKWRLVAWRTVQPGRFGSLRLPPSGALCTVLLSLDAALASG
jgi:hypothetical protein